MSESLLDDIEKKLNGLQSSYQQPATLAEAVMRMSDFYGRNPDKATPWHERWCQQAYLAYYLPLNWWRMNAATIRGKQVEFFSDYDRFIDFGSGLGSVEMAFAAQGLLFSRGGLCLERSKEAIALHRSFYNDGCPTKLRWQSQSAHLASSECDEQTLAVFSYSFTELKELPPWVEDCGGLMIVEPATQDDGRRLLGVRKNLLGKDWHVVAPCTHQIDCPLLEQSERDWCHDRCTWTQPERLKAVEKHMPIKNGTLPFSYLLLQKKRKKKTHTIPSPDLARMTGDLQEFKGFAKQLICRSSEREFVAWQRRDFKDGYPKIPRGELVTLASEMSKKGNELRPTHANDISVLKCERHFACGSG